MKIILYCIAVFFSMYFASELQAKDNSGETMKVLDNYLASIKNIEARFMQTDANGLERQGFIYIKKPNRIRIEYIMPDKELIVLNSDLVMHYNPDLDETNYLPDEELAISLLSQKNFRIIKQANIKRLDISDKYIQIDFTIKNDKQNRIISLKLNNNPIHLSSIAMSQGNDFIHIEFIDPIVNSRISEWTFEFDNKSFKKLHRGVQ